MLNSRFEHLLLDLLDLEDLPAQVYLQDLRDQLLRLGPADLLGLDHLVDLGFPLDLVDLAHPLDQLLLLDPVDLLDLLDLDHLVGLEDLLDLEFLYLQRINSPNW